MLKFSQLYEGLIQQKDGNYKKNKKYRMNIHVLQKGTKKETFQTFVGSGHSSSKSVITAGPRGSSRGIDTTKDSTTCSQPSSDSATR